MSNKPFYKKHKSAYKGKTPRFQHSSNPSSQPLRNFISAQGTLQVTRSGMGFVILTKTDGNDVMVRPQDFNTALNGDTVIVQITRENPVTGKREGKISEVVARKQTEFIGTLEVSERFAFFVAKGDKHIPDIYIPLSKIHDTPDKSRVIVKLLKWEKGSRKPVGEVVSQLNPEDENDAAMKELLAENGFPVSFEPGLIEEANALPENLDAAEIKKRRDFRPVLTFTIDPNDSKDFDDAISFKKLRGDNYEIGVHIADVSHYVRPGSALDQEAYSRATSVYLPDRVNPMLPEHISNLLCSLRPNEDKFTFSAVFNITGKGKITKTWIGKTLIHSDRRFTYDEVQEILDTKKGDYQKELSCINNISQSLRRKRFENGAINFSTHEIRFQLDEKAKPIGIIVEQTSESHQLIEELMLLANRAVAEFAAKTKVNGEPIPFPYRIHDQPDPTKLDPFIALAKKFGYIFDTSTPDKIAESFNHMLAACEGKPEQVMLQQLGIRTMAKAAYSPQNIGHYGLGFEDYCHFTSPIRRYPDIMVHRLIEECTEGKAVVDKEMSVKCKHCSDRERASLECERAANKYKQVEYMQQFLGEEFEGIISGVAAFGFWVETIDTKCEGLVSVKDLSAFDDFKLIEEDYSLVGIRSGRKFRMGDHVWIRVVAASLDKRQLDYEWVKKPGQAAVLTKPEATIPASTTKKEESKKAKYTGSKKKKQPVKPALTAAILPPSIKKAKSKKNKKAALSFAEKNLVNPILSDKILNPSSKTAAVAHKKKPQQSEETNAILEESIKSTTIMSKKEKKATKLAPKTAKKTTAATTTVKTKSKPGPKPKKAAKAVATTTAKKAVKAASKTKKTTKKVVASAKAISKKKPVLKTKATKTVKAAKAATPKVVATKPAKKIAVKATKATKPTKATKATTSAVGASKKRGRPATTKKTAAAATPAKAIKRGRPAKATPAATTKKASPAAKKATKTTKASTKKAAAAVKPVKKTTTKKAAKTAKTVIAKSPKQTKKVSLPTAATKKTKATAVKQKTAKAAKVAPAKKAKATKAATKPVAKKATPKAKKTRTKKA